LLCIMINIIAVIIIIIIVIVGLGFGGECLHIFHSQVLKNLRYPAPLGPKCCTFPRYYSVTSNNVHHFVPINVTDSRNYVLCPLMSYLVLSAALSSPSSSLFT
jgi:hypothetical protein